MEVSAGERMTNGGRNSALDLFQILVSQSVALGGPPQTSHECAADPIRVGPIRFSAARERDANSKRNRQDQPRLVAAKNCDESSGSAKTQNQVRQASASRGRANWPAFGPGARRTHTHTHTHTQTGRPAETRREAARPQDEAKVSGSRRLAGWKLEQWRARAIWPISARLSSASHANTRSHTRNIVAAAAVGARTMAPRGPNAIDPHRSRFGAPKVRSGGQIDQCARPRVAQLDPGD